MFASTCDSHSTFRRMARRMAALHQLMVRVYTSSGCRPAAPTSNNVSSSSPRAARAAAVFSGFSFHELSTSAFLKLIWRGAAESGVEERESYDVSEESLA